MDDGSILVSEMGTGKLLRLSGADLGERIDVLNGLQGPVQMIRARDGMVYLTQMSGVLSRFNPATGELTSVAEGLRLPEGLAELPDGHLLVAEPSAQRLVTINPQTGESTIAAEQLPIGLKPGPGMPPTGIPTALAADAQGRVYFASDIDNALYRLTPQ